MTATRSTTQSTGPAPLTAAIGATAAAPASGFAFAPPPREAYRDETSELIVLTRYADVVAAFRDPRLRPCGPRDDGTGERRDARGAMLDRVPVLDAFTTARVNPWRAEWAESARSLLEPLQHQHVDLLERFARPWCLSIAMNIFGAPETDRRRLEEWGSAVFQATGEEPGTGVRERAAEATQAMDDYFMGSRIPMPQPTFMGISQTLPRLLASGWLSLFAEPVAVERLRTDRGLMAGAVEEVLRHGGIIIRLLRYAVEDVEVGGLEARAGERVALMIGSANRDPLRFPNPDRVDISRPSTGQLSFGLGPSSCAGARLVRAAQATALGALLDGFESIAVDDGEDWGASSGFRWPRSAPFRLG